MYVCYLNGGFVYMKRRITVLFLSLLMIFSFAIEPVMQVDAYQQYHQRAAKKILPLCNDLRKYNAWYYTESGRVKRVKGLKRLKWDKGLEAVAKRRALELSEKYSHTRPDGSNWEEDVYRAKGENIAFGYTNYRDMYIAWEEEDLGYDGQAHRRNILNENFQYIGIACVEVDGVKYWVQEFGGLKK